MYSTHLLRRWLLSNVGGMVKGGNPLTTASHHTPDFYIDESGFSTGVKALANLVVDYMDLSGKEKKK